MQDAVFAILRETAKLHVLEVRERKPTPQSVLVKERQKGLCTLVGTGQTIRLPTHIRVQIPAVDVSGIRCLFVDRAQRLSGQGDYFLQKRLDHSQLATGFRRTILIDSGPESFLGAL